MAIIRILVLCWLLPIISFGQQRILLVAVRHVTPPDRVWEYTDLSSRVGKFKPTVVCMEFPAGTDTASLLWRHGDEHFSMQRLLRKKWGIREGDLSARIQFLRRAVQENDDIDLRMELHNLYLISSDYGNAQYQGYFIMERTRIDTVALQRLKMNPGFSTMNVYHEGRHAVNSEFTTLIFPFAAKHGIDYLFPIDDLTTVTEGSKYQETMSPYDKDMFLKRAHGFISMIDSISKGNNELMIYNSPVAIDFDPFKVDWPSAGEEVKKSRELWMLRNRKMAENIIEVAEAHPHERVVVFFGAAHVGTVRNYLKSLRDDLVTLTLDQLE